MLESIIQPRFGVNTHPSFQRAPTEQIIDIRSDKKGVELRDALLQSIHNETAALPDPLLWDEAGLKCFKDVTYSPSYYLTSEEIGLLEKHCRQIAAWIPAGSMLVELGSG